MIDANSNCSRVDAVKARAAQLRMQLDQIPRRALDDAVVKQAENQVDSLDSAVKKGDAEKAERALSAAASVVQNLQSQPAAQNAPQRGLDVYA